jgi:small subunit ribosomal protein S1
MSEPTTTQAADAVETEVHEPTMAELLAEFDEDNENLEAIYNASLSPFKEGEVVQGSVVEVLDDFVLVDIGYKSEGAVALHEFYDPAQIQPGAIFDFFIEEPEDEDGMPILSKIKADKIKNWEHIQKIYEDDGVIEGRIVRRVKGGLKVDIGVDAFMPASQLTWRPTSDLDKFLGERMEVKIIKLTKRRRNVVVSRRKLLEEQRAADKEKLLEIIEVGRVIPGEVKNITDFGAFVDVGGIDGLLHVTDMSWGRVKHPSHVVSVGDRIDVMVLNFDPKTERISLGLKQKSDNPWKSAIDRYPIGSIVRGRVVSMTDYGAFIQLEDGIEGMVHVSEMSWTRRVRHPSEVVNIDDQVDVMVLNVDADSEKIALGLKQTLPNPWKALETTYPVGSPIEGIVRNITDYGAFIEIEEGIDALLHVSDISWTQKVSQPSEVLEKGQKITVKVLSIDPESEKISVGLKQMDSDPWEDVVKSHPIGSVIEAEIAKIVNFGAFARLENGVEGLIHISEISKDPIEKPEQALTVGDKVQAKVINIDSSNRKIGLSIRQQLEDGDRSLHQQYGTSGGGASSSSGSSAAPTTASAGFSMGEALGNALPQSLLQGGAAGLAEKANEMLKEDKEPAAEKPAVEAPAVEEPVAEAPAVEEPAVEEAVVEAPAAEEPAVEEPKTAPVAGDAAPAEAAPAEATDDAPAASDEAGGEEKA